MPFAIGTPIMRGGSMREPLELRPREHSDGVTRWVYLVMDEVIAGIEAGDPACVEVGLELIEEDQKFQFGKTLKSTAARALRRASLSAEQVERVVWEMFITPQIVPTLPVVNLDVRPHASACQCVITSESCVSVKRV